MALAAAASAAAGAGSSSSSSHVGFPRWRFRRLRIRVTRAVRCCLLTALTAALVLFIAAFGTGMLSLRGKITDRRVLGGSSGGARDVDRLGSVQRTQADAVQSSTEDELRNADDGGRRQTTELNQLAVCMVGGTRNFEMTGGSIFRNFFQTYSPSDLFIVSTLDANAAKIPLFIARMAQNFAQKTASEQSGGKDAAAGGITLAAVQITPFLPVDEQRFASSTLSSVGSLAGRQGFLQQFKHIEGCWDLVVAHEKQRSLQYEWGMKLRLDSFWSRPPLPLSSLPRHKHTIPEGKDIEGGWNDQFSIFGREWGDYSMRRLTYLAEGIRTYVPERTSGGVLAEHVFRGELEAGGVPLFRASFPYCIPPLRPLQHWPPRPGVSAGRNCSSFVYSILGTGDLNGMYCGPCKPCMEAEEMKALVESYPLGHDFHVASDGDGVVICDTNSFPDLDDLHAAFLETLGPEVAEEARGIQQRMDSLEECIRDVEKVRVMATHWLSGSSSEICLRAKLREWQRRMSRRRRRRMEYHRREEKPVVTVFDVAAPAQRMLFVIGKWDFLPTELYRHFDLRNVDSDDHYESTENSRFLKNVTDLGAEEVPSKSSILVPFDLLRDLKSLWRQRHFPFCQLFTVVPGEEPLGYVKDAGLGEFAMVWESCQRMRWDTTELACTFFSLLSCVED